MNRITDPAKQALFQEDVLTHLANHTANGTESLSFLQQEVGRWGINGRRWTGLSNLNDFRDTLLAAGFTLTMDKNFRTTVSL